MKAISFFCCIFTAALLVALYTSRHNQLIELRIRAMTFEKEVKVAEAKKKGLELALEQFFSPIRLEEIARKAQYAYLQVPSENDIVSLEE